MKLADAQQIGAELLDGLASMGGGFIAGSVRRQKPEPRDIEIMLPLPMTRSGDDPAHDWILDRSDVAGGLFTSIPGPPMFTVVKGLRRGFKYCQLVARHPLVAEFKIDIFRYSPGNLGWQMLIRTGSAEFSRACAMHWNRRGGTSRGGFLIDSAGAVLATPTEQSAFRLLGIQWVDPVSRRSAVAVAPL